MPFFPFFVFLIQVCLRRLLTVAVFLLPWTLCSAAPLTGLNQDTPAGNHTAIVNTRRRHQHHQKNNQQSSNHHQKHHQQHRHHHEQKSKRFNDDKKQQQYQYFKQDNEYKEKKAKYDEGLMKAATTNLPVFVSDLVAFSKDRPPQPPWEINESSLTEENGVDYKSDSKWSQQNTIHNRRSKRSGQAQQAVCDTVTEWQKISSALDIFGNNVTVMEKILTAGGQYVNQWFYETKCDPSGGTTRSCRGIDTSMWTSQCLNRQSFVYAMVRTSAGEEGWNWIAIDTTCNCALRRRSSSSRGVNRRAPYPFVALTETERR